MNAEIDVVVEIDAHFFGAPKDIFAIDRARERLIFQLLAYAFRIDFMNAAPGFHVRACGQKPGKLVAGVQGFLEAGLAGHPL